VAFGESIGDPSFAADLLLMSDADEISGWWSSTKKFVKKHGKKALKAARKVQGITRSTEFRAIAVGVSVAFPAAAPALAAVEAANQIAAQAEKGMEGAQKTIELTEALAAKGDKGARRAARYIELAKKGRAKAREAAEGKVEPKRPPAKGKAVRGTLVLTDGSAKAGLWVAA